MAGMEIQDKAHFLMKIIRSNYVNLEAKKEDRKRLIPRFWAKGLDQIPQKRLVGHYGSLVEDVRTYHRAGYLKLSKLELETLIKMKVIRKNLKPVKKKDSRLRGKGNA